MCERVFSAGFGPGLDSMSPVRSKRTATTPGLRRIYVNLKKANWDRYRQDVEANQNKNVG